MNQLKFINGVARNFCNRFSTVLIFLICITPQSFGDSTVPSSACDYKSDGSCFRPRLGTFHYVIHWNKTDVAQATVTMQRENDHYRLAANSKTTGLTDKIYRIQFTGEGIINVNDFSAIESKYSERIRSKKKDTSIYYREDGRIESVQVEKRGDGRTKTKTTEFTPENGVLDIFSFMTLARSFDWKIGLSERFEVFTGKKTEILTLNCIGHDVYQKGQKKIDAWIIAPAAMDPAKKDKKPQVKETWVYLSADESRDILKIKTQTAFGTVKARLIKFTPH